MKNLLLSFALASCTLAFAQVKAPQASPAATVAQTIGLTETSVVYSRPSLRGREVMGNLVPYGKIWRTGANKNTTIQFPDPVQVGGQTLAAGTYAIFTRPGASLWEVFFYTDSENSGIPKEWSADKVAATLEVEPQKNGMVETFSIWFYNLTNNDAVLNLAWENTRLSMKIEVPTVKMAMASIKKVLANDPKHRDYYLAAVYYLNEGQDLKQAKKWINKAIAMKDDAYWYFRQQSLILAGLNETAAAIEAAKNSLKLAKKAGNQDYIKLNTESIAEWSK